MSDFAAFRRDEVLAGMPARRASTSLYAIERRTVALVHKSREALASYLTPKTAEDRDTAFMQDLASGREGHARPSAQDLEGYASRWSDLVPADPGVRAAIARLIGQQYRLTPALATGIRTALALDEPETRAAFERLHSQPIDSIWVSALSLRERISWRRARLAYRLEHLPAFWTAYALTLTETVGAGVLALPIAMAGLGILPGLVLLVVLGLVNLLTVAALVEAITRNGSMRYGTAYFGRLVSDLLGRAGSVGLGLALLLLNVVTLLVFFVAFSSVLAAATGLPQVIWVGVIFLVDVWYLRRESLDATVASAIVIGAVNIGLVIVLSLIAFAHLHPENLAAGAVPVAGAGGAGVLALIFGVMLMAFFGHTSAANAAKVVLERDPTGRSLLWGNVAALATVIVLYAVATTAFLGAIGPTSLAGISGTVLTPLASALGPSIAVIGSVYVVLSIGLGSIYVALGLFNQAIEVAGAVRPQMARRMRSRPVRLTAGIAPTVAVFLGVEALLLTGTASFTEALGVVGILTVPLLGGLFPMLLVAAARRRGEYVPGQVIALLGHPVTVAVVSALFLAGVFVHALVIWQTPWQQAAALVVGCAMVILVMRVLVNGSFRPRTVIEVRRSGREGRIQSAGVVSRGRAIDAPVRDEGGTLDVDLPASAAAELLTWAHLVTADGDSEGIGGTVRISNDANGQHASRLVDGRLTSVVPSLPATVSLALETKP